MSAERWTPRCERSRPGGSILGLDAQLLLGVLPLLHAPQLALPLGAVRALGVEHRGGAAPVLFELLQARLQRAHMAFERAHGRFGGLGATLHRGLARLRRAPCATLGEEVGLPHPPALTGCVALLDHRL